MQPGDRKGPACLDLAGDRALVERAFSLEGHDGALRRIPVAILQGRL
jgi:hypothetical protein